MEPFFAFLIVLTLFVLAPMAVFRGIRGLRDSNSGRASEGSAIRRSDLQAMIDDAVIEATAPLIARLDELEHELLMGEGRISPDVLADALDDPDADTEANHRTTSRSARVS
ncbi:MAG: hypothetical protein AAF791_13000 [Bacteroidota bacterium]